MKNLPERFRSKFITDESGCWLWTATINNKGYGQFYSQERRTKVYAHRWSYEHNVGPIPEGLVIDHLCRTPRCVNPEHLEPVTFAENLRRGEGGLRRQQLMAARTHCRNGHEFIESNVYRYGGERRCRACYRARDAGRDPKKEPLDAAPIPPVTHCKWGHEFTPENTYVSVRKSTGRKERLCRTCRREAVRRSYHKKRKKFDTSKRGA